jgi:hypothetical protein
LLDTTADQIVDVGGQVLRSIQQVGAEALDEHRAKRAKKREAKQEEAEFRREVDRRMKTMPPTIERWRVEENLSTERYRLNPPIYEDDDEEFQYGHPPEEAARWRADQAGAPELPRPAVTIPTVRPAAADDPLRDRIPGRLPKPAAASPPQPDTPTQRLPTPPRRRRDSGWDR